MARRATSAARRPLAAKICDLHALFLNYSLEHPELLEAIPDQATVVFLDDEDPRFSEENKRLCEESLKLRQKAGETVGPLVHITIRAAKGRKDALEVRIAGG